MPSAPSRLRDSTQIILPGEALDDVRADLEEQFVLTVHRQSDELIRIVGSPVEIKNASAFLTRRGVTVP